MKIGDEELLNEEREQQASAIMEVVRWPRRKWQSQKGEDKGKKGGAITVTSPIYCPGCLLLLFLIRMMPLAVLPPVVFSLAITNSPREISLP